MHVCAFLGVVGALIADVTERSSQTLHPGITDLLLLVHVILVAGTRFSSRTATLEREKNYQDDGCHRHDALPSHTSQSTGCRVSVDDAEERAILRRRKDLAHLSAADERLFPLQPSLLCQRDSEQRLQLACPDARVQEEDRRVGVRVPDQSS